MRAHTTGNRPEDIITYPDAVVFATDIQEETFPTMGDEIPSQGWSYEEERLTSNEAVRKLADLLAAERSANLDIAEVVAELLGGV